MGLVGANAFFVVGEYALITARRAAVSARAEAGRGSAAAALRLMDEPVRVISTVQVGITAIGILIGAIGEPLVRDLLGGGLPHWAGFLLAFAIVTYLSVVLGELVPKAVVLARAETLAVLVARPIELIGLLLRPVVAVLQRSARLALRPLGVSEVTAGDAIRSADELRVVIDEAERTGIIPRAQEELLHNIFDFARRDAADVMIPAPDVHWLDARLSPEQGLERALASSHSRFLVGDGSLNRIVGFVHLRDLASHAGSDGPDTIRPLTRPVLVVPETKPVGSLLHELRQEHQQLALIADEYGGTAGIVTIEDLLEEIVGEIEDEHTPPEATLRWLDDDRLEVAGSMTIDDFNHSAQTALAEPGMRTLAGLVFDALGRLPTIGETVTIDDIELRVHATDAARITTLHITLPAAHGASRREE